MKILAVNWLDIENPQAGGAEIHFFEIFQRLVEKGCDVTLVTSGWQGAQKRAVVNGIDVRRFGGRHSFTGLGRRAVRETLAEGGYDILVEDINKLPLYLSQVTRLPTYVIIPHLFGTTAFREAPLPIASLVWFAERPVPWVYRNSAFHAISESTRDDLVARGVSRNKIRVIHPGVDAEWYNADPAIPRSPYPTFLYVGRLKRYKGVDVAIRALPGVLSVNPHAQLLVAGSGDDRSRLEGLTHSLDLGDSVKFLGFVTEERKRELFRTVWSVVFPSLKEGWGMTNVEAAACGTPAIAADSPGLRDSVIDGQTGLLIQPGDVPAFSAAMCRMATDSGFMESLGAGGRTFASSLTWEAAASETHAHIEETILAGSEREDG